MSQIVRLLLNGVPKRLVINSTHAEAMTSTAITLPQRVYLHLILLLLVILYLSIFKRVISYHHATTETAQEIYIILEQWLPQTHIKYAIAPIVDTMVRLTHFLLLLTQLKLGNMREPSPTLPQITPQKLYPYLIRLLIF